MRAGRKPCPHFVKIQGRRERGLKKRIQLLLLGLLGSICLSGCRNVGENIIQLSDTETLEKSEESSTEQLKYVFLFIGDGMSYSQIQLTNYYLNAVENEGEVLRTQNKLNMLNLAVTGSAQTYDSTSFTPDSASSATAIATGHKTWSGCLNVSEDFSEKYETIAEKLKKQKDYKIGIVSSVNINHATPAAFYAHQESRSNYYEIGLELLESDFDYFAGGGFRRKTGDDGDKENLYDLAKEAGYMVVRKQEKAQNLKPSDDKVIVVTENMADRNAMNYELDRENEEWALADYVEKGIELLENETGFFMMVEGGKIDWACHANDAGSMIADVIALDEAIGKALDFYERHPDETLILVTGDHETGGLSIGFAGTNYDTFLTNLKNQKISYVKYDADYVSAYRENETPFENVMEDITELFGLQYSPTEEEKMFHEDSADAHENAAGEETLELTNYEYNLLKEAYEETMQRTGEETEFSQEDYIKYGSYEPLTVTITHILNNKSGINFSSYAHTGLPVEVFAQGVGAEKFNGYYDNTEIYKKLAQLVQVD